MDTQNTLRTVITKQREEKDTDQMAGISNEANTTIPSNSAENCWQPTSDESFEVIEKMCNKTASDPNSTLFQYLNSDHKEEIVEIAKKRSKSDGEEECCERAYDAEARALKRLLDELRLEEQIQLENESPLKGVDVTSLEDVEPPSKLWETTITNETISKTSPIKMVGLLRPSTIIEECDSEDISFSSDILTHETTDMNVSKTTLRSEVSSSCYETAKDSTTNSKNTTANRASESFSKLNEQKKQTSNETNEVTKECNNEKNYLLPEIQITEATLIENLSDPGQQQNLNSPESTILDEMEVKSTDKKIVNKEEEIGSKPSETDSSDSDVSIIEIFSEDDSDENSKKINFNKNIKYENVSLTGTNSMISINSNTEEKEKEELQKSANDNDNDIEMISKCSYERKCSESPEYDLHKKALTNLKKKDENGEDEEKEREYRAKAHECNSYSSSLIRSCSPDLNSYDNKENCIDFDKSLDKSLNFNDTLEEVEYMMKKGAQYLATSKKTALAKKSPVATKASPLTPHQAIKQNRAQINSPSLLKNSRMSPSPNTQRQKTPLAASQGKSKLTKTTPKSAERFNQIKHKTPLNTSCGLELKPFPKLELFKKPTTLSTAASHKRPNELTTTTKQFSHIVSPIRAYINNSTNTPLMTTINHVSKNPNSLNSLHELERESRLYKPNFMGTNEKIQIKTDGPCHLPKKAYISSEFKCIVDKRTPVTIPGGSQYQKHIEIAMLPAVLKHEGKIKKPQRFFNNDLKDTPSKTAATPSTPNVQRAGNESVGDLSLASGDISMYTIKDARKF